MCVFVSSVKHFEIQFNIQVKFILLLLYQHFYNPIHKTSWPQDATHLAGKEVPTDFNKDLVVLIWSLVTWHNDLSAGEVLQLIHLHRSNTNTGHDLLTVEPLYPFPRLTAYRFSAFADDSASCGWGNFDMRLQLDLFLRSEEILLFQLSKYPALGLGQNGGDSVRILPWAWAEHGTVLGRSLPEQPSVELLYLELSLRRTSNDHHPLCHIGVLCWSNLDHRTKRGGSRGRREKDRKWERRKKYRQRRETERKREKGER